MEAFGLYKQSETLKKEGKAYGIDQLEYVKVDIPQVGDLDILVKILASGVNPVDAKVAGGLFVGDLSKPKIPGYDAVGIVERLGEKASKFKIGDRVYFAGDATRNGTFAQYVAVDERVVAIAPKGKDTDVSTIPLVALTVLESFAENMNLGLPTLGEEKDEKNVDLSNKTILIPAGAGGVGSFAIQAAKNIYKFGTIIATASRKESQEYVKSLGADLAIGHHDIAKDLKEAGIKGVDYVLLAIHDKKQMDAILSVLNPLAQVVSISGDPEPQTLLSATFVKRVKFSAELMFSKTLLGYQQETQGQILAQTTKYVEAGLIKSQTKRVLKFSELKKALDYQSTGSALGKTAILAKKN